MFKWSKSGWCHVRDVTLFVAGLALTIHEAVFTKQIRTDLLVLFAGMMGLPAVLRADESRNDREDNEGR